MQQVIDLETYPIDQPETADYADLVEDCRTTLQADGAFNLPGFLQETARAALVDTLTPLFRDAAFTHARSHNIYFKPAIEGLAPDHPALAQNTTINHTLCADQLTDTALGALYHWPPFARFLADIMGQDRLYPMSDPLAAVNAMAYHAGEALNWHFDRSEFTTTLLLQSPRGGGAFEYVKDLRSDDDPNYEGVARLLTGALKPSILPVSAGTINVFKGRNTAHRVSPVTGSTARMIAVFSYFYRPNVQFSEQERLGFYGRSS